MATSPKASELSAQSLPKIPPSKPLQIFLLVALVVSGAAYVADECNEMFAPKHEGPSRLKRLVEARTEYTAHLEAGMHALRANQYGQALEQFRLASQAQHSAEVCYDMALALMKVSRPDEAMAQFKEAARLNPHYTEVYLTWGQALLDEGKPDEAAHVFHGALQASPNSGPAHFQLAQALLAQMRNAESDYRAADNEDHAADAVALKAKVEQLRGEALQNLASAERLGLDRPEMWLTYGRLLASQQKFGEAETYLRRATTDKPDMADAHYELGLVEDHLNKYADAIGQYEATLALRADDPPTLERLALLYATSANQDLRSPKMAIQLGIRANDAASQQNARYMDTLARCYASDGNFLEAINWEDKAIKRAGQIHDKALLRELQPRYDLFIQHKTE